MFSDKKYIVYVHVYQKQVVYAHLRKVKFPKTIRHTSVVAYNFHSEGGGRQRLQLTAMLLTQAVWCSVPDGVHFSPGGFPSDFKIE